MSIGKTRRSVSIAAGVGALAVSALFTGHLAAHQAGTGPEARSPRMYRRAVRQLGLSEEQQTRIRGILRAHADEIGSQLRAGLESRRALHAATLAQPADEAAIRRLALELGEVKAEDAVLRARIRSEIWPILTAEQQQRARNFRSQRGRRAERRLEALDHWLRSDG
jgi:Spy/CpxP family protein refolding chaperone